MRPATMHVCTQDYMTVWGLLRLTLIAISLDCKCIVYIMCTCEVMEIFRDFTNLVRGLGREGGLADWGKMEALPLLLGLLL